MSFWEEPDNHRLTLPSDAQLARPWSSDVLWVGRCTCCLYLSPYKIWALPRTGTKASYLHVIRALKSRGTPVTLWPRPLPLEPPLLCFIRGRDNSTAKWKHLRSWFFTRREGGGCIFSQGFINFFSQGHHFLLFLGVCLRVYSMNFQRRAVDNYFTGLRI